VVHFLLGVLQGPTDPAPDVFYDQATFELLGPPIEFSRWGDPASHVAQFVAQPFDYAGNVHRFDTEFSEGELASHAFRWLADRVVYRSWRGGPTDEAPETRIETWSYSGPHLPRPEQPRVHINLWQFENPPAAEQEVVLDSFTFLPEGGVATSVLPEVTRPYSVRPNPFDERTSIHFTQRTAGLAQIHVYDVAGRLVRDLGMGSLTAGEHQVTWDGRGDEGARLAPGIYFVRIHSGAQTGTKTVVLLR
jgi:hypothetical protein